jgi:hypothetical protein
LFLALVIQFKHAIKPLIVFAAIPFGMAGSLGYTRRYDLSRNQRVLEGRRRLLAQQNRLSPDCFVRKAGGVHPDAD